MFEKDWKIQFKSRVTFHKYTYVITHDMVWNIRFRVSNLDTVKGTQEKTRAEKGQKVKKVNTVIQVVTIEF